MTAPFTTASAVDAVVAALTFNQDGLVCAVAQQHDTLEVLMVAWMNVDAVRETLMTGQICYWSRSRSTLWRKGESSGQTQRLIRFRIDCDGDSVLLLVDQSGVACHTGRRTCFFRDVDAAGPKTILDVETDPSVLYGQR